jgi:hypothetical protein
MHIPQRPLKSTATMNAATMNAATTDNAVQEHGQTAIYKIPDRILQN